jgi:hypothetical protein
MAMGICNEGLAMRIGLIVTLLGTLTISLSGCDVFYTARYYPDEETSATLTTSKPVNSAALVTAIETFAAKWKLRCSHDVPANAYGPAATIVCSGNVVDIQGNVSVINEDGRPLIYFTGGEPGGSAFFSRTAYCQRYADIQSELEKYVGPLKLAESLKSC